MKLPLLKQSKLNQLKASLPDDWNKYSLIDHILVGEEDYIASSLTVPSAPTLDIGGPGTDARNAAKIFSWLHELTPTQAADERIWAGLTLKPFREYVTNRWPPSSSDQVKSRFFYSGAGSTTAVRNGISRLWWFGYLSYDEKHPYPFHLTDVLLSNQDIQQSIFERSIGRCRPLLTEILRYIKTNKFEIESKTTLSSFSKTVAKDVRLRSGVLILDGLHQEEISKFVESSATRMLTQLSGRASDA